MWTPLINLIDKIIPYTYKGLIVVLPLFFLPWTTARLGADNFNKLFLLWLIVPVLFFLQFYVNGRQGKVKYDKTWLDLAFLLFTAALLLSSIFSIDRFSSFWGGYNVIILPFFAQITFLLFYFFSSNYLNDNKKISEVTKLLPISLAIIIFFAVLIFVGALSKSVFFTNSFKLAAGTLEELSVYIATINILLCSAVFAHSFNFGIQLSRAERVFVKILLAVSFVFLFIINFTIAWLVLFVGISLFSFLFLLTNFKDFKNYYLDHSLFRRIFWPTIFLVTSFLFLIANVFVSGSAVNNRRFAQNLQLDYVNTAQVVIDSLKQKPIFGFGADNFSHANSFNRSQSLNNTEYWNLRFEKASTFLSDIIITGGLLGVISYLLVIGIICTMIVKIFFHRRELSKKDREDVLFVFLFSSLTFSLVIGQIFFTVNITLLFLFWLFLSLFVVSYKKIFYNQSNFAINNTKTGTQVALIVVVSLWLGWLLFFGVNVKYWIANIYFNNGLELIQSNRDRAINKMQVAIKLSPYRYNYQMTLAEVYLLKGLESLRTANDKISDDYVSAQSSFEQSIKTGQYAIKTSPNSVAVYEMLGKIYREISPFLTTANESAIELFSKASKLEPTNPVILTELGKLYFNVGQTDKAAELFVEAIKNKNDYNDAKFNLAKAYNELDRFEDALTLLYELEDQYEPALVFYEEGRVFYNQERYDQAISKFRQTLLASPNHANALYSLALAFQKIGEEKEALYYFKKVSELNPGNQEIKNKLEELNK